MSEVFAALHSNRNTVGAWGLGQSIGALTAMRWLPPRGVLEDLLAGGAAIRAALRCAVLPQLGGHATAGLASASMAGHGWVGRPLSVRHGAITSQAAYLSHTLHPHSLSPCCHLAASAAPRPCAALEPQLVGAQHAREATVVGIALSKLDFDPGEGFARACLRVAEDDRGRDQLLLTCVMQLLAQHQVRKVSRWLCML